MTWVEWYIILCLSGGITSAIISFLPALRELKKIEKEKNITHTFVERPLTSFIVWAVMHSVTFPILGIFTIFSEKKNISVIESITKRKYNAS
jgi:hypothetical protein